MKYPYNQKCVDFFEEKVEKVVGKIPQDDYELKMCICIYMKCILLKKFGKKESNNDNWCNNALTYQNRIIEKLEGISEDTFSNIWKNIRPNDLWGDCKPLTC